MITITDSEAVMGASFRCLQGTHGNKACALFTKRPTVYESCPLFTESARCLQAAHAVYGQREVTKNALRLQRVNAV